VARIKGSALLGFVEWYVERFGERVFVDALQTIPEDERGGLHPDSATLTILPTRWYPVAPVHRILEGLATNMSAVERDRMCADAATAAVDQGLRGVFKLAFTLLVTPERYAKHIQRFWNQLHDTGEREVEVLEPGLARSTISGWRGHHPILCQLATETMGAVFRKMGCEDVRVERVRCSRGGPCVALVHWRVDD